MPEKINLSKLVRLAREATPGPWHYDCGNGSIEKKDGRNPVCERRSIIDEDPVYFPSLVSPEADMRFIESCNPQTILALCECIRTLADHGSCCCDSNYTCGRCEALQKFDLSEGGE
jgi:hypothetical protein